MVDALETSVGYVFVVGGRAVSAVPPGALVESPPRKTQRSREQDTFFTLITPGSSALAQASFYEQLARRAADLYFKSSGSVTSGLREVIGAIHNHLLEHNQVAEQQYEVNIMCLVLRGHELFSARSGVCISLLRQGEDFLCQPEEPAQALAISAKPGSNTLPDIKLSRYEIGPGHVIVLADGGLGNATRDQLSTALGAGLAPAVIEGLKPLCAKTAQAMVIEFSATGVSAPSKSSPKSTATVPRVEGGSPKRATGIFSFGRSAPPEPEAASTSSPVAAQVSAETPVSSTSAPGAAKSEPLPLVPIWEGHAELAEPPVELAPETEQDIPVDEQEPTPEAIDQPDEVAAENPSEPSQPLPPVPRALSGLGLFLSRLARAMNFALDRVLPPPAAEQGPKVPAMLAAVLVIFIPVVVVFIFVALRLSQFDMTQFEQQVRELQDAAEQASMVSTEDATKSRTAWEAVMQRVDLVESTSGRTNDPSLMRVRARAQEILDTYDKVTRRTPVALRNFGEGAQLGRPVIRSGADVYTLDRKDSAIYRDTLNPSATALFTRNAQPVVQRGQAVGAFSVRQLIDIAWVSEGGVQRPNVLAALDVQGILVTYSPTFSPATAQRLAGTDLWEEPVRFTVWRGRLYILDSKANQLWRYQPVGNSYPNPPEEYFNAEVGKPDLSGAVDFAIDLAGNVFVLFSDGRLKKYTSGVEQPFAFSGLPNKALKNAVALYLDSDSALPAIYILDAVDQSVYQITLSGAFRFRFRATDNAFKQLTGIFADRDSIFVTSGPALYYFSISDVASTTNK